MNYPFIPVVYVKIVFFGVSEQKTSVWTPTLCGEPDMFSHLLDWLKYEENPADL